MKRDYANRRPGHKNNSPETRTARSGTSRAIISGPAAVAVTSSRAVGRTPAERRHEAPSGGRAARGRVVGRVRSDPADRSGYVDELCYR